MYWVRKVVGVQPHRMMHADAPVSAEHLRDERLVDFAAIQKNGD